MTNETGLNGNTSATPFDWSRCGSILVVTRGAPRDSLNLRVPSDLKRQIEENAAQSGISINAAACLLLLEGLRAEERRRR